MGADKPQKLQFKPGRVETRLSANVCIAVSSIKGIIQASRNPTIISAKRRRSSACSASSGSGGGLRQISVTIELK